MARFMNETETRRHKLFCYVADALNGGKIPNPLKTLAEVNDFKYAFNEVANNRSARTIITKTKLLFERFGFNVTSEDIGWKIS